jgi:hypothetical protein
VNDAATKNLATETTMKRPASNCTLTATCPCSDCMSARIPSTCPVGCACLVCLVDGLSANPPPRAAIREEQKQEMRALLAEIATGPARSTSARAFMGGFSAVGPRR